MDRPGGAKKRHRTLDPARPLHVTTNVTSSGLGDAAAALPRSLGQGKRRVWCGVAVAKSMLLELKQVPPSHEPPRPEVESLRGLKIKSLGMKLSALCHEASGAVPPVLALERYLLNALATHDGETASTDPLIPGGGNGGGFAMRAAADNLIADLIRASITVGEARAIADQIAAASAEAAEEVAALERQLAAGSGRSRPRQKQKGSGVVGKGQKGAPKVVIDVHRHSVDVFLHPSKGKHILKLNVEHYEKLRSLWDLRNATARSNVSEAPDANEIGEDQRFRDALFVILSRYFALQG